MSIVEELQQGNREISVPSEITLADGEKIACVKALRVLPRKRAVFQATWEGKPVLVKLMLNTASGKRDARREQKGYQFLKSAKILTPELLFASRCVNKSHVLVYEFLQQAQRLGDLWRDSEGRKSEVAAAGLGMISDLHRQGCIHTDPHLDNFLSVGERVYVIDAASIRRRANVNYGRWQRRNLAVFMANFTPAWQKILSGMLPKQYAEAGHDLRLMRCIGKTWERKKSRYLKKCFRECSEFSTRKSWRQNAVWRRDAYCDDFASFLRNPEVWMERGDCLKDGNSATVVRVQMGERQVVIKRNNRKNIVHWLQCLFRTTRAHANWRSAHLLAISGISTPRPVAFLETRWGPLRLQSYYLCEFNPAPSSAIKYKSPNGVPPTEQEVECFKELFENLRLARIYHGDLKARNLLVGKTGLELIDLDSVKECAAYNISIRLKKDRERFLLNWNKNPELQMVFSAALDAK